LSHPDFPINDVEVKNFDCLPSVNEFHAFGRIAKSNGFADYTAGGEFRPASIKNDEY
jgi:hypothetical protein